MRTTTKDKVEIRIKQFEGDQDRIMTEKDGDISVSHLISLGKQAERNERDISILKSVLRTK
tara:strand:+ start:23 stop:205 length:183 start_codon:yes stop_codon:yes gene_type:complete